MALADVQVKKAKNDFLGRVRAEEDLVQGLRSEYLEYSKANKAKSSYERDVTTVQKHLVPVWGEHFCRGSRAKTLRRTRCRRLEQVTASTVNRELSCITNMFNKAVEWEYLRESPGRPSEEAEDRGPAL
jgi:site-specific recombinase XerD